MYIHLQVQVYKRLVDLLGLPGADGQAAAVGALYNFAEINMDCRVRLANERWYLTCACSARLVKFCMFLAMLN